jgi:hypothetical protein
MNIDFIRNKSYFGFNLDFNSKNRNPNYKNKKQKKEQKNSDFSEYFFNELHKELGGQSNG